DAEEGQLVRALLVIASRDLDRIAGVAQLEEVDPFDDAPIGHVEAGNDAFCQAHKPFQPLSSSASAWAAAKSSVPSYMARPVIAPMMPSSSTAHSRRTSSRFVTPPLAMTGMRKAWAKVTVASILTPESMPSRPISV